MTSMPAAPIRQPRGPSTQGAFGKPSSPPDTGPPVADSDSLLRRNNTIGSGQASGRHAPSASVSAQSVKYKESRFRSGSLSTGDGLVRKTSENSRQEVVIEDQDLESPVGGLEGGWGKGLGRQSSLPSRRGYHQSLSSIPPVPNPPPRPPRRIDTETSPSHAPSHSLGSLAMLSRPVVDTPPVPSVSRTQSLRNQAKASAYGLGRTSSLRQAGEHHHSPPSQPNTPNHPFTPPSPPPQSSTAALPPFQLPLVAGSDIKRHQSLGSRVKRLDRTAPPHLEPERPPYERTRSNEDEPPTSPLGHSVWSPQNRPNDDGWSRSIQGVSESLAGMGINMRGEVQVPTSGMQLQQQMGLRGHDEPAWIANLVGGDGPPRPPSAPTGSWSGPQARWDGQYGYGQQQVYPYPGYKMQNYPYMQTGYPAPNPPLHFGAQDAAVIELARQKGLNPATFDCRPPVARFFVIKSYTEEDVQKSLKHEIWSSTVLGNKRLDAAFKESAEKGPIYLFFSVNGSRHFCGVAEMLTPVDETRNSNVWTQDKWKGIFSVKWIFVRDVPSAALRHIRLIHTPEQKPITNSRDTQELHYEAGCEVLQIFLDHQTKSKTSLLQDFAYYETLSVTRSQSGTPASTPNSSQIQPGQQPGMLPPQPQPMLVNGGQPGQMGLGQPGPGQGIPGQGQYRGPPLNMPMPVPMHPGGIGMGMGPGPGGMQMGIQQMQMPMPGGPGSRSHSPHAPHTPHFAQGQYGYPGQGHMPMQMQGPGMGQGQGQEVPPVPLIPARFR